MSDPEFILLKDSIWPPLNRNRDLLGSVVLNCLQPLVARTPKKPSQYIAEDAKPQDIEWNQFDLGVLGRRVSNNHLSLKGFFSLRGSKQDLDSLRLRGKQITYRYLVEQPDIWKAMTAGDKSIVEIVAEWTKGNRWYTPKKDKVQPYWVTGVLICKDVNVATKIKLSDGSAIKGGLPAGTLAETVGTAMGYPIKLDGVGDLALGHDSVKEDGKHFSAKQAGQQIFALQLKRVVQEGAHLTTTYQQPDVPAGRRLAEGDIADPTLELKEMDEEDWQELLMNDVATEA